MLQHGIWHIVRPARNFHIFIVAIQHNVSYLNEEPAGKGLTVEPVAQFDVRLDARFGHSCLIVIVLEIIGREFEAADKVLSSTMLATDWSSTKAIRNSTIPPWRVWSGHPAGDLHGLEGLVIPGREESDSLFQSEYNFCYIGQVRVWAIQGNRAGPARNVLGGSVVWGGIGKSSRIGPSVRSSIFSASSSTRR